jgi:hypothetical protein
MGPNPSFFDTVQFCASLQALRIKVIISRQVYLEGLKRRSESLKPIIGKGGHANMCSIS